MKPRLVSAIAVLICIAIISLVGAFGYSRYKAAQMKDDAFQASLVQKGPNQPGVLGTHMPAELGQEGAEAPSATPTP